MRLTIAFTILWLLTLARPRPEAKISRRTRWMLALAGLALAVHFAAWIASLDDISVAVSTLLVATTPLFTAAYDAVTRRRGIGRWTAIAFAVGGLGLYLVAGLNRTPAPHPGHELLGAVLALAGAAAFAAYLVLVRDVRAELSTRTLVRSTYGWAALTLTMSSLIAHQAPPAFTDALAWGGIIAMALVSQLIGHTAINASLRWFSPSTVSFTNLLEPVIAALLALAIFHEPVSAAAIVGGTLILLAVLLILRTDPIPESD